MLLEVTLQGVTLGGMYALVAMGLTLQYGVARIMNLSYGELLIAAAFAAFWFYSGLALSPLLGLLIVPPLGHRRQARAPDRASGRRTHLPARAAARLCSELFRALERIRGDGISVLLVEQNAKRSLAIADRGYLIENGRIVGSGRAADLARDPAVQRAYLGGR